MKLLFLLVALFVSEVYLKPAGDEKPMPVSLNTIFFLN